MTIAVVRVQGAFIVVRACNTAACPAEITRAREGAIIVDTGAMHVTVMRVQCALVVIITSQAVARPAKIARTRE